MTNFDLRPQLGRLRGKDDRRLLFVCYFDPCGIATVYEYIALWQRKSRYQIEILNIWPSGAPILRPIALGEFDGCILHSTVSYHIDTLSMIDQSLMPNFANYDGVKILIKQDEHRRTNAISEFLCQKAFDLLITCVPPGEIGKVYPRERVGKVKFIHALTGYVSPYMRALNSSVDHREFDVTYRGSIQPLSTGRLGLEKRKIAYDVAAACAGRGLQLDISNRWEDRINGTAWFDFLARSKAVLGVESGSNLFDFTGEVEKWCDEFCRKNRDRDQASEQFYNDAHAEYLKDFEGNVQYAAISPRHFEAAATRTLQILYEGKYSGVLKPSRHFVPLRRDLANLDEVLDIANDERRRREITEAAYEEIIGDPRYRYDSLVSQVDQAIDAALSEKGQLSRARRARGGGRRRALLLMAHEPELDPRIAWMGDQLSREYDVCEIGTYRFNACGDGPSLEKISEHRHRLRVERTRHDWDWVMSPRQAGQSQGVPAEQLMRLFVYRHLPRHALSRAVGAIDADLVALDRFRKLCAYFVDTNGALVQAARLTGSFDVIVAADLETLPAALMISQESKAIVVYDAHEYWPYSYRDFRHWEIEFWASSGANPCKGCGY